VLGVRTAVMTARQLLRRGGHGAVSKTAGVWRQCSQQPCLVTRLTRPPPPAQVIGPDKHGIKTVIEYKVKEDGTKARAANWL
jgi:hypothetical protein